MECLYVCYDSDLMSLSICLIGPLVFQQTPVFDTDVEYGGLLRTVNITDFNDKAVRINQDSEVSRLS